MAKQSNKCKIPSDEQKIVNAFMRTLLEMQDNPDQETIDALERDREESKKCRKCDVDTSE
jgi:hypothetical protein